MRRTMWCRWITTCIALMVFLAPIASRAKEGGQSSASHKAQGVVASRIVVRGGRFVEESSGREFRPRGFNYIRLKAGIPVCFAPSVYSAKHAEAMLVDLHRNGFNIVRVFLDASAETMDGLNFAPRFIANTADFLQRAQRQEVHVLLTFGWLPPQYDAITGPAPEGITGPSLIVHLSPNYNRAKAQYITRFITALKKRDASLLATIFSYELFNEVGMVVNEQPFTRTNGTFSLGGKTYDLASEVALQELVDDGTQVWANTLVATVHSVDPHAMVSASIFTFAAVGRTGPGHMRSDRSADPRFPLRPLALVRTSLSYIDIHLYSYTAAGLKRDLESIEWDQLKPACWDAGKPLLMGEFGAFKSNQANRFEAAAVAQQHLRRVLSEGFGGYLYWTYDCDEQSELYNAKMGDDDILKAIQNDGNRGMVR